VSRCGGGKKRKKLFSRERDSVYFNLGRFMNGPSRPRKTANLSESIHQQLNMYAFAATAAGVGVLALAKPAQGKIIYTSTHHVITQNHHYKLDLNHDEVADFGLSNYCLIRIMHTEPTIAEAPEG
jgi:hypothetical protein